MSASMSGHNMIEHDGGIANIGVITLVPNLK